MYFKIIEKFEPESDTWMSYLDWRKFTLYCFDSVDGMLRRDLFVPESIDDWGNCVKEDYKINLITNLPYAKKSWKNIIMPSLSVSSLKLTAIMSLSRTFWGLILLTDIVMCHYLRIGVMRQQRYLPITYKKTD